MQSCSVQYFWADNWAKHVVIAAITNKIFFIIFYMII